MGGKSSKEEPKQEEKPTVKTQLAISNKDGAEDGQTPQRSIQFLLDESLQRRLRNLKLQEERRPTTSYLPDDAVGGQTLQRSNSSDDETQKPDRLSGSPEFTKDESFPSGNVYRRERPATSYLPVFSYYDRRRTPLDPPSLKHTIIKPKKSSSLLVAAIDFGTTYSGYAYSFIEKPNDILTNYWEKLAIKTPTVVLMDEHKRFHSFGDEARRKYEQLMKTKEHKKWYLFERFKMKLFVKEGPLEKDMEIEDMLDKPMKAIDVFTEAIRYIRSHLLDVLNDPQRKQQIKIEKETDIHWVLTVPAIWNDLSKKFMREAANKAGIPDDMLTLALEPEAASVFCKNELGIVDVPVGCRYLVLDLGGGTADITCHEVNPDGTLKELFPPTGGAFGGTTVDNKFIRILNSIFGADLVRQFKKNYTNEYWELMSDFELKKRKFNGSGRVILKFPIRLLELFEDEAELTVHESMKDANIAQEIEFKQGKLFISEQLMKEIFSSAVNQIVDKTAELLQKVDTIEYIILVGGFSDSVYLQNVMRENFDNLIILPKDPSGAVLKGAVMYGHKTTAISSRKCRYTYGIARMIRYDPEKHHNRKKVKMGNFTYCDDAFNKHIEVGTEVSVHSADKAKAHEYFPSSAEMRQAVLEVYKSPKKDPMFVDEEDCEFVGLRKVDIDPKGDIWSKLWVKLIFGGTELKIQVKDVKNGTITTESVDFLG